ncbi:DnaJ-domain-containing protein [Wallemia mellicola]|uniref:DnaJ-domain-containing protein n=1 Tax=Wallemia mellicola TaxID=1708541 RepID=A0A4T0PIE1_9BASI|nr:DnaJ-domain-containing protein [Wallemia mellicola]TIB98492.1 DnaJ-domain-containing protein [Wallemia mellicola]TIC10214.1 DnaJ-domain-containing protein [Wallemia mellicola]TIC26935.1 DnaJ-domain-containing protein [Wallemia mellicola]
MRFTWLIVLCALLSLVVAWEKKEDYEIFDIVAELEAGEGKGTTFYSFLNVSPSATSGFIQASQITKAYRSTMLANHPDKNPGNKLIEDRHKRLTTIGSILRNKEARKRYDFWLKRGVPYWKGGAYMFSRFRPGLGTVLIFLAILTSGLQALVQHMNASKDISRIQRLRTIALSSGKHRARVPLREEGDIFIDCIVENDEVFLLEPDNTMELLTDEFVPRPSIRRLWPVALVFKLLSPLTGMIDKSGEAIQDAVEPVHGEEPEEKSEEKSEVDKSAKKDTSRPLKASEKMRNTRRRKAKK